MNRIVMSVFVLSAFLLGCGQGNERLAEKASIEGDAQLRSQYGMLAEKAKEMEQDLAIRHRFFQAVRGTYEGTIGTEIGEFKVRVTLVPSLPPYVVNRTRQLEEISEDLNNLYFNAQVVQWNPANNLSAVGCRIERVRPDILQGEISIASENCPNVYSLRIGDSMPVSNLANAVRAGVSAEIAASIREGRVTRVNRMDGEVLPTTNAAVYNLSVTRN